MKEIIIEPYGFEVGLLITFSLMVVIPCAVIITNKVKELKNNGWKDHWRVNWKSILFQKAVDIVALMFFAFVLAFVLFVVSCVITAIINIVVKVI